MKNFYVVGYLTKEKSGKRFETKGKKDKIETTYTLNIPSIDLSAEETTILKVLKLIQKDWYNRLPLLSNFEVMLQSIMCKKDIDSDLENALNKKGLGTPILLKLKIPKENRNPIKEKTKKVKSHGNKKDI